MGLSIIMGNMFSGKTSKLIEIYKKYFSSPIIIAMIESEEHILLELLELEEAFGSAATAALGKMSVPNSCNRKGGT